MLSPLYSGRTFTLNTLGSDGDSHKFSSLLGPTERVTVPLYSYSNSVDPSTSIEPIYDTGASVSVVSQADFNRIRHNTYIKPLQGWDCSVAAANGALLRLTGAYLIRLYFQGKSFLFAFLVSADITDSLFGLNLACHYNFSFDAVNKTVFIPRSDLIQLKSQNGSPVAQAALVKAAKIDGLWGQKVLCRLRDNDGNPLAGAYEGLLDVGPVMLRFDTDKHGRFEIHYPNPHESSLSLSRDHLVGHVYSLSDATPIYTQTAAAAAASVGPPAARRPRLRKHTPEERKSIIAKITQQICASVPYLYRQEYIDLLTAREHAFSADDFDLGYCDDIQHEIHFQGTEPCYTPQFRLSADHLSFLKRSVLGWLKAGIVQRTRSLHNSPIFCVEKKAPGKLRPVLDYRRINSRSLDDRYSILTVDDCLEKIGHSGASIFSSLDFRNSYWQLALRASDRPLTAFTLPGIGQFAWQNCPQGLLGAPASYSRLMQGIMLEAENIITYIDDTLIFTRDHKTHIASLKNAIDRIIAANLRLNPEKCIFASNSLPYLGVQLQHNGLKPGLDKTKAVADVPPPTTLKQLKSVCGLFNWFRKFIFAYARKVAPLHRLTKGGSGYKSGTLPNDALTAFYRLRSEITSRPLLAYPNPTGKFHLYVDASLGDDVNTGGYGAALLQEQPDGSRRPVAFASRLIAGAELNYPTTLSEWNAATYGMSQFSHYLRGKHFYLYSDHKPLARPFEKLSRVHIKTLYRLNAKAEDFHPELRFIEGKSNACADFLSRYFGFNVSPDRPPDKLRINANVAYVSHRHGSLNSLDVTPSRLRLLQANDPHLKPLIAAASDVPPLTLVSVRDCQYPVTINNRGFLCVRTPPRDTFLDDPAHFRIVCPDSMKTEVLNAAHHSLYGGHAGNLKVAERIRDTFWWKNMSQDISSHLSSCSTCRTASNKFADPVPPLKSIPCPSSIGELYFSDLFGPLTDSKGNSNTYVLTVTDAFSKFVRLYKIDSKEAVVVADTLYKDFSIWSPPRTLVTDGGPEYKNAVQSHLMKLFGTSHKFTAIYHPQTDGTSEVFNRTLRHFLATALLDAEREGISYETYLPALSHSYNSSVSHATHVSPFTTHFGIPMRVPLWPLIKDEMIMDAAVNKSGTFTEYVARLRRAQFTARQLAHDMAGRAKSKQASDYNKRNKVSYSLYKTGDRVLVKRNDRRMTNQKLAPNFEPAIVLRQVDDSTYLVRRYLRKRSRNVLVHGKLIKRLPVAKPNPHQMSSSDSSAEDMRQDSGMERVNLPSSRRSHDSAVTRSRSPLADRSGSPHSDSSASSNDRSLPPSQGSFGDDGVRIPLPHSSSGNKSLPPQRLLLNDFPPISKEALKKSVSWRSRSTLDPLFEDLPPLQQHPILKDNITNNRSPSPSLRPPAAQKRHLSLRSSSLPPRRRRRVQSESSLPGNSDRLTTPTSPIVSDHELENGPMPFTRKHKFSHTSSDPLLAKLPRLENYATIVEDGLLSDSSLDSDGFPHALSSSDSDMSSIRSSERRRRRRKKRSLPSSAHSPRRRKKVRFSEFADQVFALRGKKRNKFYNDFSNYSMRQLFEAFMAGKLVADFLPPLQPTAGAKRRLSPARSPSPADTRQPPADPPTAQAPAPSLFASDRSALRSLSRSLLRAPRLLLHRSGQEGNAAPWVRWLRGRQNRLPDPRFSYTGHIPQYAHPSPAPARPRPL